MQTDCILKGLGQALGYALRIGQQYNKPVELVIAGPNEHSDGDLEFIDFIKAQLIIPVSYLKINYEPL